ncbi:MAG: hypothetical protein GDA52_00945 [Rhodobacteraceae bacterium]|nr:hypothetical protein [Paracoccaceae bacterium]
MQLKTTGTSVLIEATGMEPQGKDKHAGACPVSVPLDRTPREVHIGDPLRSCEYGRNSKVSRADADEWIAVRQHDSADAVRALAAGSISRAPCQALVLV